VRVLYESVWVKLLLPKRFVAITLGSRVYTRRAELSDAVLRHERAHVEQWRRYGRLRFPLLYLWYHWKHGYEKNPFEVEARRAESDYRIPA
jgi:hypothetical protein